MKEKYQEFLLEVGAEEIPAWMLPNALAELKRLLTEGIEKLGLAREQPVAFEMYATPRRLVAYCPSLAARQPRTEQMVQGPPKRISYDEAGKPTAAAVQFAAKMGTTPEKLRTVSTPKGEYVAFRKKDPGQPTAILLRKLIPEAILGIPWPRAMYWESKAGPHFIRPIRWLLALYGGKLIPCSVGSVKAGRLTYGHRQLGKPKLAVTKFETYRETLRENFVILDAAERRSRILESSDALLHSESDLLRAKPDPALLDTLTNLTEYPTPLLGSFDPAFLALPEEVLVTVMRGHQKYFAVERRDAQGGGKMAPHFVAVMETDADPTGLIRHGHERVLRARFNDARFFWETDGKTTLDQRREMLRNVTFQAKLGSYFEKSGRLQEFANLLIQRLRDTGFGLVPEQQPDIVKAARLAKCDLTTDLVKEFTELQGVVGGLCARREGMSEVIAAAIYDHYRPQSMEDALPRTLAGDIVSLADRMDTLTGCFGVGLAPTGSKDPFGLRRAAQGVIRILAEKQLPLTLDGLVAAGSEVYARAQFIGEAQAWNAEPAGQPLVEFLEDRLRYYLREVRGFEYDEINAVLTAGGSRSRSRNYDVVDILKRADAVHRIRPTGDFEPLAASFKRMKNILQQAVETQGFSGGEPNEYLFREDAERQLYEKAQAVGQRVYGDYFAELEAVASLRPNVDLFFDKILVMDKDAELRNNRLSLIESLLDQFSTIADFSEIVPKDSKV